MFAFLSPENTPSYVFRECNLHNSPAVITQNKYFHFLAFNLLALGGNFTLYHHYSHLYQITSFSSWSNSSNGNNNNENSTNITKKQLKLHLLNRQNDHRRKQQQQRKTTTTNHNKINENYNKQ